MAGQDEVPEYPTVPASTSHAAFAEALWLQTAPMPRPFGRPDNWTLPMLRHTLGSLSGKRLARTLFTLQPGSWVDRTIRIF